MDARQSRKGQVIYTQARVKGRASYRPWRLGEVLGQGGFGCCYEAHPLDSSGPSVAVKVISKAAGKGSSYRSADKVRSEVALLQRCQSSHTVEFLGYSHDEHHHYLLMALCSQGSLSRVLSARKSLTEPEVRFLLAQLADILATLATSRVVHRDIKPGNLLLDGGLNLRVGDFGSATSCDRHLPPTLGGYGTLPYLAPETITSKEYSPATDLWSVGVIVFEALTGELPFRHSRPHRLARLICSAKLSFEPHWQISPEARQLVTRMLQPRPAERINLAQLRQHPFLNDFPLPKQLEPFFASRRPSLSFMHDYSSRCDQSGQREGEVCRSAREEEETTTGTRTARRGALSMKAQAGLNK